MARQRRELEDQLADIMTMARGSRTISYSTPEMAPVGPGMIEDNAILNEHLAEGAVRLENLNEEIHETLEDLANNGIILGEAQGRLDEAESRLDDAFDTLAVIPSQLEQLEIDARAAAADMSQTFFQSSKPPVRANSHKDLWINTGAGNTPNRYDPSLKDWVPATDAAALAVAKAEANDLVRATKSEILATTETAISESKAEALAAAEAAADAARSAAGLAGAMGRTWFQAEEPPVGTVYDWVGAANSSVSTRSLSGAVVATNYFLNPGTRHNGETQAWSGGAAGQNATLAGVTESSWSKSGWVRYMEYTLVGKNQGDFGAQLGKSYTRLGVGKVATVSFWVTANRAITFAGPTIHAPEAVMVLHAASSKVTAEPGVPFQVWQTFSAESFGTDFRAIVGGWGSREVGDRIEFSDMDLYEGPYDPSREWFSGDTPDDRENDLWIDTANGNTPKRWDGAGWVAVTDTAAIERAITAAATDAAAKADAAQTAAIKAASTAALAAAKEAAEAAEARAAVTAAADAKNQAAAAQAAAIAAAKTYTEAQASGAGTAALNAAKADATSKADAAKAAAIAAAALDATAKKELAESNAAADAKTKADKALADAKADATTKADAAKKAAVEVAAADATAKANAARDESVAAAANAADLAREAAGLANSMGRTWFQPGTPPAGYVYDWAGTAFESASTLRDADGKLLRTNMAVFPAPGVKGWGARTNSGTSAIGTPYPNEPAPGGHGFRRVTLTGAPADSKLAWYRLSGRVVSETIVPGRRYRATLAIRASAEGLTSSVAWRWHSGTAWLAETGGTVSNSGTGWKVYTFEATAPANAIRLDFDFGGNNSDASMVGNYFDMAYLIVTEATDLSTEYFDGSTPDERDTDLWIDTDEGNTPKRWDGKGWSAVTDQAAITAATEAAAADAKAKADAALAAALAAAPRGESVVLNGSFEQDFTAWDKEVTQAADNYGIDETVSRSGTKSFWTVGRGGFRQLHNIPVSAGQTWEMSLWYKTEAHYSNSNAGGVRLQSLVNGVWGDAGSTTLKANTEWTRSYARYVVPAGVTALRPRFAFNYQGGAKCWVDDIEMVNVTAAVTAAADATTKANAALAAARSDLGETNKQLMQLAANAGNMAPYGDLESLSGTYFPLNASMARSGERAFTHRITTAAGEARPGDLPVTAGNWYQISYWMKADRDIQIEAGMPLLWVDAAGTMLNNSAHWGTGHKAANRGPLSPEWKLVTFTVQAPADMVKMRPRFYVWGAANGSADMGATVYMDDLSIKDVTEYMLSLAAVDAARIEAFAAADRASEEARAAAGLANSMGRTWFQAEEPPAGNLYNWTGAAGTSQSEMSKDGVVLRRNLIGNPRFQNSLSGWSGTNNSWKFTSTRVTVPAEYREFLGSDTAMSCVWDEGGTNGAYFAYNFPTALTEATPVAFKLNAVGLAGKPNIRPLVEVFNAAGARTDTQFGDYIEYLPGAQHAVSLEGTLPAGTSRIVFTYYLLGNSGKAGDSLLFTSVIGEVGTKGEYFDGNTPDDREMDLWIDTDEDNTPKRWNGSGWTAVTDKAAITAAVTAAAADATVKTEKALADAKAHAVEQATKAEAAAVTAAAADAKSQAEAAEARAAVTAAADAKKKADAAQAAALAAAKTYAAAEASGASADALAAAKADATAKADAAKAAAITAAATDATAKKEQAEANAAADAKSKADAALVAAKADAKSKADAALVAAKADATSKADAAKAAAITAADTAAKATAKAEAEAAEARAAVTAAADAKKKADAAQAAALAAAKTYSEAQASGAGTAALDAAKADATSKADAAKAAAIAAAALDATAKKESAEATAAADAKTKADAALASAKTDATTKANAAQKAAVAAAATDATTKADKALADAKVDAQAKADAAKAAAITAADTAAKATATAAAEAAEARAATAAATIAQTKADAAQAAALAAAKTYADAEASGAGADALAKAKADATTKADAAKKAAIDAAALDATAKKEAAEAAAAVDAKTKADAALAAAKTDATTKADAAKAAAITAAAADATTKADAARASSMLAAEAAAAAAREAAGIASAQGRTWFQAEVPPEGAVYDWEGVKNNSFSLMKVDGLEVRRNHFPNPGAMTGTQMTGWGGNTGNVSTTATVDAPWSKSGKAHRRTWTTITSQTGDHSIALSSALRGIGFDTPFTVSAKVRVGGDIQRLNAVRVYSHISTLASGAYTSIAGSPQMAIMPGSTYTVWATGTAREDITSDFRMIVDPRPLADGDFIEFSEIMAYEGAYDPNREWFWGDTPDDRENDLWIDTDEGNTPKRWDGTGWVAVTDQAAITAATAAAAADATAKADAAQAAAITAAAADATKKADAAKAAAVAAADTAAKATAKAAAEAAEARVAITAAADAKAKADAAQAAALAAAKTYADAEASGAGAAALTAAKADATTKANAAKAAAIAAAAADATAKKESAEAIAAADAKSKADAALTAAKADAKAKADAALGDAKEFTVTKMNEVANSKNASFYSTSAPSKTATPGTLAGDTWRRKDSEGNIIGEWEWDGEDWTQRKMTSASMTAIDVGVLSAASGVIDDAVARTIAAGTASIQKADIGNLTVTGNTNLNEAVAKRMAADVGTFIELRAGAVTADNLEANMVLSSRVIAGDPVGTRAEMSPEGFRVYAKEKGTDDPATEVVRMGVAETDDYFAVTRADGTLAATISQDGKVSGSEVWANEELYYRGEKFSDILESIPRGPLYKAELSGGRINNIDGRYGLVEVAWTHSGDRLIRLDFGIKTHPNATTSTEVYLSATWTHDGSRPTINSSPLTVEEIPLGMVNKDVYDYLSYTHTIRPSTMGDIKDGDTIRMLMVVRKGSGNPFHVHPGLQTFMYVTDIGRGIWHTPNHNNGGGTLSSGSSSQTTPKVTRTQTWQSIAVRNYQGNGSEYRINNGKLYQGLSPAGYGNLTSCAIFPDMTGTLSGATINRVRVYLYAEHWYYNAGGTARIGLIGKSLPSTFTAGGLATSSSGWPKPGGRWVDIPSNLWNGFQTGGWGGISLNGDGGYGTYGYFAGNPKIEITYTK